MSANAGFHLFPPPPSKSKPARKLSARRNNTQPQVPSSSTGERAKSPETPADGRRSAMSGSQTPMDGRQSALDGFSQTTTAAPVASSSTEVPRSQTSMSEAPTLVRSHSSASHSSIAKPKLTNGPSNSGQPMIRSIFPRYNPDIPLEHQNYYPTQASPTHIPRTIISKAPYSPTIAERTASGPMSAPATVGRFPKGIQDVQKIPDPSSTEELKELWKVANGWRVSASEARSFCMKMTSSIDEPVHTLSSATQPFYTMKLEPTSTSAHLTLCRLDPNKLTKGSGTLKAGSSKANTGIEVLATTLEETARRFPPNDGLVALLYPKAASNVVLDLASKPNRPDQEFVTAAAENECARLVWDDDSKTYYLVHPALPTPFRCQITSSPAWSRVEYTFEHPQLPVNLVKLTRDGIGGGYLEVDTGTAGRIDCYYLVDVAICAIVIVALAEEKSQNVERFEPPPIFAAPPTTPKGKKPQKMEEMEVDLESQSSLTDKNGKPNLPKPTKGALKILYLTFRFVVWVLSFTVNAVAKLIICVSECLTTKR